MGRLESLDSKECREGQDPWEHPETRASLETKEQRVLRVYLVLRDPEEMLARMEGMAGLDLLVLMDHPVTGELLGPLDPGASRACQVLQARMGLQDRMVLPACRESWA